MDKMPIRTMEIADFPAPYEALRVTLRVNAPMRVVHQFEQGGYDNLYAALEAFIVEWNAPGADGQTLPISRAGLEELGPDLFLMLQEKVWDVLKNPLAGVTWPEPSKPS